VSAKLKDDCLAKVKDAGLEEYCEGCSARLECMARPESRFVRVISENLQKSMQPYLGQPLTVPTMTGLRSSITQSLKKLQDGGQISGFESDYINPREIKLKLRPMNQVNYVLLKIDLVNDKDDK
jgi:hypothetical protein